MLKKISEQCADLDFILFDEYKRIEKLFSETKVVFDRKYLNGPNYTVEEFANIHFLKWHLRGSRFIDIYEMRQKLNIDKDFMQNNSELTELTVLQFLQYSFNCTVFVHDMICNPQNKYNAYFDRDSSACVWALFENIDGLLELLKAIRYFDDKEKEYVITYSDAISDAVAINHSEIEKNLYEYRSIKHRGNLQRKREILFTFYREKFEVNTRKLLKDAGYGKLENDTGFLLGEVARHHEAVMKNKAAAEKLKDMSEDGIEDLYDIAYDLFLACMAILPCIDVRVRDKIDRLKT